MPLSEFRLDSNLKGIVTMEASRVRVGRGC
jgi:hypothetical protein